MFLPWDLVTSPFINLYIPNNGISIHGIHIALVVTMSDKPQTSFQVVRNNLFSNGMHTNLVNPSIQGCSWHHMTPSLSVLVMVFIVLMTTCGKCTLIKILDLNVWIMYYCKYMHLSFFLYSWVSFLVCWLMQHKKSDKKKIAWSVCSHFFPAHKCVALLRRQ